MATAPAFMPRTFQNREFIGMSYLYAKLTFCLILFYSRQYVAIDNSRA